ncbi:MAG TPA: TIGR00730 family Rossman fold protein, partial [Pseudomonas sp.]|nr:TIGR00730 family Rossman fold protein [Pseudomonas sp.]
MSLRSICVFCGASRGTNPVYEQAAQDLGRTLAANGIRLVYGGGAVGLMGVVADATMAAGGEVIGIIPQSLKDAEVGHTGLSRLEVVDGMHARKARMAELADAFIALPGGLGTLEELFEVWTWGQ